jgi:hypothetical protein
MKMGLPSLLRDVRELDEFGEPGVVRLTRRPRQIAKSLGFLRASPQGGGRSACTPIRPSFEKDIDTTQIHPQRGQYQRLTGVGRLNDRTLLIQWSRTHLQLSRCPHYYRPAINHFHSVN